MSTRFHKFGLALLLLLVAAGAQAEIKYVLLFIGDGFGPAQRELTETLLGRKLMMSTLPTAARTGTDNYGGTVTDSAASGTAIACGVKTNNGVIGMDHELRPVASLAARLKERGFKVGLVSSSPLNDATPAAHYAHQPSRSMLDEIAAEIPATGVDYLGGAALAGNAEASYAMLQDNGYTVIAANDALTRLPDSDKVYAVAQPFTRWTTEQASSRPTLAEHTRAAIAQLYNPDGFFLMVENGHTDYAGHSNDAGKLIHEVVALDEAVQAGLAFQALHPQETLLIVTADHETGGLNIDQMKAALLPLLRLQKQEIGAIAGEARQRLKDSKLTTAAGLVEFFEDQLGLAQQPFTAAERQTVITALGGTDADQSGLAEHLDDGLRAAFRCRDARLGIAYTTGGHSGAKIITNAAGPGCELFAEPLENSDIPQRIEKAMSQHAD